VQQKSISSQKPSKQERSNFTWKTSIISELYTHCNRVYLNQLI
jgi:hypothetical protein